jgi:hypothetical protein
VPPWKPSMGTPAALERFMIEPEAADVGGLGGEGAAGPGEQPPDAAGSGDKRHRGSEDGRGRVARGSPAASPAWPIRTGRVGKASGSKPTGALRAR